MRVSERTIAAIGKVVTGDGGISPYRSGPILVRLFNEFGANDSYGQGFPSRWAYAEEKIRLMNDSPALAALLKEVLDPREFLDSEHDQQIVCDFLNERLKYDGYEIVIHASKPRIRSVDGASVSFEHPFAASIDDGRIFINEQIEKCEDKIREGDYDGAVTNARSMIEGILIELERELEPHPPEYDGDLLKLYKRVQKQLQLDPARADIENTIKQVLTGLVSIVSGVAGLSNKMGDRHARTYKPAKRHAVLVVNCVKTLGNFLYETFKATR